MSDFIRHKNSGVQLTVIHKKSRFNFVSPPAVEFVHIAVCVTLVREDAGDGSGAGVQILHTYTTSAFSQTARGVDPYGTGGTRPPIFGLGGHYHECPPIFLE